MYACMEGICMIDIWKFGKDTTKCNSCFEQAEYEVVIKQDGNIKENSITLCRNCLVALGYKANDEIRRMFGQNNK